MKQSMIFVKSPKFMIKKSGEFHTTQKKE